MYIEEIVLLSKAVLGIAAVGLLLLSVSQLAVFAFGISQEASFLKRAMRQADCYDDRRYWENELKVLYLSMIPGISRERAAKIVHRKRK